MPATTVRTQLVSGPGAANAAFDVGFYLTLVYLFVLFSRVAENLPFHIAFVLMVLLVTSLLLNGGLGRAIFNRVGLALTGFTLWLLLSIPFSFWPGGSSRFVLEWLKAFAGFVVVIGFLTNTRRCQLALYGVSLGILWVALFGLVSGSVNLSRLSLELGRFGDANDFAQILLVGMALLCCVAGYPGRGLLAKLMVGALVVVELIAFARTGSRGGLVGLILTSIILFKYCSFTGRIALVTGLALLSVIIATVLPRSIMLRYRMLFSQDTRIQSDEEYENQQAAIGSKESRWYLLKTSLTLTLQHPLLGVGPGMFMVAENDKARGMGRANGSWHETHNMYTQVSSEAGIPALILFCIAFFSPVRDGNRIRRLRHSEFERPPTPEQAHMAFWLNIAMWSVLTSGFFLSVGFTPELQGLLGLMAAFTLAVRQENMLPPALAVPVVPAKSLPARKAAQPVASIYRVPKPGY